jgi:hypothetical protein
MVWSVASSSATVHQRDARMPSLACIAATSPSGRRSSGTQPTKKWSYCLTSPR